MKKQRYTRGKRLSALLLCLCLLVGMMPTVVIAADNNKAMQLGSGGISGYDSTAGYDYIYYGEWNSSPIKWRVLDDQTNTGNDGLFLLSDALLEADNDYSNVYFQQFYHNSNAEYHKGSEPANGDHTNARA